MDLDDALVQISEIRCRIAQTQIYRGYRSWPVAFSGAVAVAAAIVQSSWIVEPMASIGSYLAIWVTAAFASALASAAGMIHRRRRSTSAWDRDATRLAVDLFLPCVIGGGLTSIMLALTEPDSVWMLPGLWQIFFSLGVFASSRLLPPGIWWIAAFYMTAGIATLGVAKGVWALSPWAMGLPFGLGQFLAAAILYWSLERPDATRR